MPTDLCGLQARAGARGGRGRYCAGLGRGWWGPCPVRVRGYRKSRADVVFGVPQIMTCTIAYNLVIMLICHADEISKNYFIQA